MVNVDATAAAAAVRLNLNGKNEVTSVRGGLRLGADRIRRMFPLEKALKNKPFTEENAEKAVMMMTSGIRNEMSEKELSGFEDTAGVPFSRFRA